MESTKRKSRTGQALLNIVIIIVIITKTGIISQTTAIILNYKRLYAQHRVRVEGNFFCLYMYRYDDNSTNSSTQQYFENNVVTLVIVDDDIYFHFYEC